MWSLLRFYVSIDRPKIRQEKRLAIHLALAAVLTSPIFIGFRVIDIHFDTDILPPTGQGASVFVVAILPQCIRPKFPLEWVLDLDCVNVFRHRRRRTKFETRSEALVFSANNFLNKLVGNIGILGSGVMITGLVLILLKLLQ